MTNCILLVLLLLVTAVLLKCTNSPLVIHFLNFVRLFHLQVFLIIILTVFFVILFHLQFLFLLLFLFFLFIKLRIQISRKFLVCYDVSSLFTNVLLQETTDIAINPISNHNPKSKHHTQKKKLIFVFFLLHHRLILFLTVSFTTKSVEQPWVLLQLLFLLISSCVFTNLSSQMKIILTNLNFI